MKVRYSSLLLSFSLMLLIAAPWVELSARWSLYLLGLATLVGAAIFRLSND
jgi:hypothetical protein